ncbi:MAG: hypothetical protein EOO61_14265 [Hymenobacter sp.]|nr:MAG: hypothetical protein EOO61_14265 [Hymenobacter sp.]
MGTRHLICIIKNQQYRLAQYGQWDGYYKGQGLDILHQLCTPDVLDRLRANIDLVYMADDDEVERIWCSCGKEPDEEWVSMDVSEKLEKLFPSLSRNTGSRIISLIAGLSSPNERLPTQDALTFNQSGSCQYAYVIDLDQNTFEVYTGHENRSGERFSDPNFNPDGSWDGPINHVHTFSLNDLPSDSDFIKACSGEDD